MNFIRVAIFIIVVSCTNSGFAQEKPAIDFMTDNKVRIAVPKEEALSGINRYNTTLLPIYSQSFSGHKKGLFLLCLYRAFNNLDSPDVIRIWKLNKTKYELLVEVTSSEIAAGATFQDISIFNCGTDVLIDIPQISSGTGHFRVDTLFVVSALNDIQLVEFQDAADWFEPKMKDDEAPDGGTHNLFENNKMTFEFLVSDYSGSWRKALYWVRGHYKLVKGNHISTTQYKITVKDYRIKKLED
jgi:hypothetical protein